MSNPIEIRQIPCLSDNYGYLVHDPVTNMTATIDTPDAEAIKDALSENGWNLSHVLNTHHHPDHAGGNRQLKKETGCTIIGPRAEANNIPAIDEEVGDGDCVSIGSLNAVVYDVPGHTLGHIAYWFKDHGVAFVGDTLFALGCGRVFEGTHRQMWESLQKLMAMPDDTLIYCAHEYTQANAKFALSVEPQNTALVERCDQISALRAENKPTVPSSLGLEKKTNPFLRPTSKMLQETLGMLGSNPIDVFSETRRRKDNF